MRVASPSKCRRRKSIPATAPARLLFFPFFLFFFGGTLASIKTHWRSLFFFLVTFLLLLAGGPIGSGGFQRWAETQRDGTHSFLAAFQALLVLQQSGRWARCVFD